MYCPRCGARVDAGFRWCPQCGATLPPEMLRQPPPHLQRRPADDWMNRILVITVVIVLLFLFAMFAVLLFMEPISPEEEKLTVQLSSPVISQRSIGGETCWDLVVTINKVTPKDEKVQWIEVKVVIKSADGSVLDFATPILRDAGAYADPPTTQFWYVDVVRDGKMGAGDSIKVTGLDLFYEGALLQLMKTGRIIGDVKLPTEFP